jgi:hypothetical protein
MRNMARLISIVVTLGVLATAIGFAGKGNTATPPGQRYVDNGDGTITDNLTGLMWEKKTGTFGSVVECSTPTSCADPTNVNNVYSWSIAVNGPNGTLFTDFLAKMNCTIAQEGICGPGLYRDWRIPTYAELKTIVVNTVPPSDCSTPCIDPIFGPVGGIYWTFTTRADDESVAYYVFFRGRLSIPYLKTNYLFARAVRGGSGPGTPGSGILIRG